MILEWQEIDKLRQDVGALQRQISQQEIKLSNKPVLKVGNIIATDITNPRYALQEIGFDFEKEEAHVKVGLIGSDPGPAQSKSPHSFLVDSGGNKFLLPDSNRVILIRDNGDGTGKQVEVDIDGNVTFPPGVESKNLVVAEPTSQFHGGNYPWKTGRLIPGIQLVSTSGVSFFLVFCQGFGEATETSSVEVLGSTLDINHDTAGHIIQIEISGLFDNFWKWDGSAWTKLADGPTPRTDHILFWSEGGEDGEHIYLYGGKDWDENVLRDLWKYKISTDTWTLITNTADPGYRYGGVSYIWDDESRRIGGGYDENGVELQDLWYFEPPNTWTPKLVCPVHYKYSLLHNSPGSGVTSLILPHNPTDIYIYDENGGETWDLLAVFGGPANVVNYAAVAQRYVSGGELDTGFATNQFYFVSSDVFPFILILTSMPGKRKHHRMATSNLIKIFVFGGIDENNIVKNDTFVFDGPTQTWSSLALGTAPQARWGHYIAGRADSLFMFGGKPTI